MTRPVTLRSGSYSLLPLPKYDVYEQQPVASTSTPAKPSQQPSQALVSQKKPSIPKYGHRQGWKPKDDGDFADGGAYPECHLAQYPLGLGKKAVSAGATLALQVDKDGKVRYDAIAQRGHSEGVRVQSAFKDLVPMALRTDITKKEQEMERPSEDEVMSTAEKTRLALEKIVNTRIAAAQPKNVPGTSVSKSSYVRYTPGGPNTDGTSQRIIKMTEVAEDPLEPPRFKHKKGVLLFSRGINSRPCVVVDLILAFRTSVPRGPSSPPPPVLRSPPRRATAQDQKDWMIPPCVSNWKNNKGYTIPLDKRLAADGRGLQDIHINDKFATFSESLYIADRHARDEVRQRAAMQQRIAEKEKEAKEETLRLLAARARDDRAGMTPAIRAGGSSTAVNALAGYGSGSEDGGSDSGGSTPRGEAVSVPQARLQDDREEDDDEDDTEEARERDRMRAERRKERERELRMNNMGSEQRARVLARFVIYQSFLTL